MHSYADCGAAIPAAQCLEEYLTYLEVTGPFQIVDGDTPVEELHVDHAALGVVLRLRTDVLAPGVDARAIGAALAAVLKPVVVAD